MPMPRLSLPNQWHICICDWDPDICISYLQVVSVPSHTWEPPPQALPRGPGPDQLPPIAVTKLVVLNQEMVPGQNALFPDSEVSFWQKSIKGWDQFYFPWLGFIFNFLMFVVTNKRNSKISVMFSVRSVETIITFLKITFSPPKVYLHGLFGAVTDPARCSHFPNKLCRLVLMCLFPSKSFHLQSHLLKACLLSFMVLKINTKGKNKSWEGKIRPERLWDHEIPDRGFAPGLSSAL